MTNAQSNALRTIFRVAWNKRRADVALSMSAALVQAWAEHKAREAFFAQTAAQLAAGTLRKWTIKSPIVSPVERAVRRSGTPYARTEARDRSRLTTALGI